MRASEMKEGRTYRSLYPIGETWPSDPEMVEVNEPTGNTKDKDKDKQAQSGLRRVWKPI